MRKLNVVVYVTGSIANYKTLSLVRALVKQGQHVRVVMTKMATRFVRPLSFQVLSRNPVITDGVKNDRGIVHVDLARWTDVAIVMPATANFLAKAALGIADDVASTCLLATTAPKIMVPAMNNRMLENPATQRDLTLLRHYPNDWIWGPVTGQLAEGTSGRGRMLEPRQVIRRLAAWRDGRHLLAGKKMIVTAGGTQEPLDPVRFITNHSSGKMGIAIAKAAHQMGAQVRLIYGNVAVDVPRGFKIQHVQTTEEMARAVVHDFPKADALIMAAALADFRPAQISSQKIKKDKGQNQQLRLTLQATPDVLKHVAQIKRSGQIVVGFAAETQHLLSNAVQKMRQKHLDLMVANNVADHRIGFGSDDNQVTFLQPHHRPIPTPVESKTAVAVRLLKIIAQEWKTSEEN